VEPEDFPASRSSLNQIVFRFHMNVLSNHFAKWIFQEMLKVGYAFFPQKRTNFFLTKTNPSTWQSNVEYIEVKERVLSLKVVNDTSERAIGLMTKHIIQIVGRKTKESSNKTCRFKFIGFYFLQINYSQFISSGSPRPQKTTLAAA
jgi:hypothetical protein